MRMACYEVGCLMAAVHRHRQRVNDFRYHEFETVPPCASSRGRHQLRTGSKDMY